MVTKEWTAIHRKHHAKCETVDDPHSPQILGIKTILTRGAELYKNEAANQETLEKFGHGTPLWIVCIWCLSLCRFALVFPDLTTCYRAKGVWDLGYVFNLLLSLFIKKYVGKTVFVKYISVLMK